MEWNNFLSNLAVVFITPWWHLFITPIHKVWWILSSADSMRSAGTSSAVKPSARCLPEIVVYGCLDFTGVWRATRFSVDSPPEMFCLLRFFSNGKEEDGFKCALWSSTKPVWTCHCFSLLLCSLPSFSHLLLSPEFLAPPTHCSHWPLSFSKIWVLLLFPGSFFRLCILFWFLQNQTNSDNCMSPPSQNCHLPKDKIGIKWFANKIPWTIRWLGAFPPPFILVYDRLPVNTPAH